ncbi:MAG: 4-hydroxy-3-methylbut-2-enyl diphosphate reductase [Acholeplasmatales bacterium]|nr:4-hydroxy-3-methylbut-2-enyl diphosphate reductase [Acholeplasmatales bacterium]
MIIKKIEPQGFCGGVKRAIEITNKLLEDKYIEKPIYMLGSLIHNAHIISSFTEKGIILLDDKLTKEEMINMVDSGTIIISAHGLSPKLKEKAFKKGLNIVDTTCPYVELIHTKIKDAIKKNTDVIYIGTKSHPEVCGVLGISDNIHLVSNEDDINNLNITNDKIYVTNQTTLSIYDIKSLYDKIKEKYPNVIIDNKICQATTVRQEAVYNQEKVDLCIIVGDKLSSNTKKLYTVSSSRGINTILIDSIEDIKNYDFKNINTVSISSGASTPSYLVDEIIEYIKNI